MYLATREERVNVLKAGISIKDIELAFVRCNGYRIINSPILPMMEE